MLVTWGAVVALGGTIAVYGFRSWRRTRTPSMLMLSAGFVLLSVVTAGMWLTVYMAIDDPFMASVACSGLMAGGFGVIFAGLRSRMG
jgi:hypothetical protein